MIKLIRQTTRLTLFINILLICFATAAYLQIKDRIFGTYHCRSPYAKRYLGWICRAIGLRVHVDGNANSENCLVVSNHISWADIPVLGSVLPVYFLSKAEVRRWPAIGRLAQEAGTVFIKRGDGKAGLVRETIEENLSKSRNVLVFPEGTTSDGSSVLKFHSKLIYSAVKNTNDVQPLCIQYYSVPGSRSTIAPYIGDDSFPSHLWRLLGEKHIDVDVTLFPPITINNSEEVDEITEKIRGDIGRCLISSRSKVAPSGSTRGLQKQGEART